MSTVTVSNTVVNLSNVPVADVYVEIRLRAPVSNQYSTPDGYQLVSKVWGRTNSSGVWTFDLVPNEEISPDGTIYEVWQKIEGQDLVPFYITVPTSGSPLDALDLLTQPGENQLTAASQLAFDPESSGMSSTNVEDAIIEAFENGGGGGGTDLSAIGTFLDPIPAWGDPGWVNPDVGDDSSSWIALQASDSGASNFTVGYGNDQINYVQFGSRANQSAMWIGYNNENKIVSIATPTATTTTIHAATDQTAPLLDLKDDNGDTVFSVGADGSIVPPLTGTGAVDSVNGQIGTVILTATDLSAQPLDSDLTAIAALSTTAFGRSLLALADAAALQSIAGLGTAATQNSDAFDPAGAAAAAIAASQPLDSDLTAIASLSTTVFGRSLLTQATDTAARSALGLGSAALSSSTDFQPIDSDLTAIAASTTTVYGRALLTQADAAAARATLGLGSAATTASTAYDVAGAAATAQAAAIAASQPLDSDLTAIAALTTTSFGRAVLVLADAAALRTAAGLGDIATHNASEFDASGAASAAQAAAIAASQPLDADLTAVAALTTATFGRSLLTQANAGAARTTLGLGSAATSNTTAFDASGAAAAAQAASQPLDSDLTAIAALSTTSYGRGLLALANVAALKAEVDGVASRATFSNADYSMTSTDLYVAQVGTLSAARTVTLPAASSVPAGRVRVIVDESNTCTATNTISIARAGSDTINGGTSSYVITSADAPIMLYSNGTNGWVASKPNSNEVKQLLAGAGARLTTSGDSTTLDVLIDVQEFSVVGTATWTKPTNALYMIVDVVGAGLGGASGASKTAGGIRGGGGGGGNGGRKRVFINAADVGSTETVTIGDGGIGGTAATSGNDGVNGVSGGTTSFGSHVTVSANGGFLVAAKGTSAPGGSGGTLNDSEIVQQTGGSTSSTAAAGDGSGNANSSGSGAGGGAIDAANTARNGGTGGTGDFGGTAGTAGTGSAGAVGGAGTSATKSHGMGGGGGGGAPSTSSATSGGVGGAGGFPGGGGGGGGAGTAGGAGTSGAGGKAGRGRVRVITYIGTP